MFLFENSRLLKSAIDCIIGRFCVSGSRRVRYPARSPARPKKVKEKPGILSSRPKIRGETAPPILPPAEDIPSAVALESFLLANKKLTVPYTCRIKLCSININNRKSRGGAKLASKSEPL